MKKPTRRSAFTVLESTLSITVSAVVVGAAAAMTVVTAKLTRSSAANSSSAAHGQVALQRVLQDIRESDAALTSAKVEGVTRAAGQTCLHLRQPSVDTAGRPLPGEFELVTYYVTASGKNKTFCRYPAHSSQGTVNYAATRSEKLGLVDTVDFKYFGRMTGTLTRALTTGLFDGQVSVNPTTIVKAPGLSGAVYVEAHLNFKDTSGNKEYFSGALMRNTAL